MNRRTPTHALPFALVVSFASLGIACGGELSGTTSVGVCNDVASQVASELSGEECTTIVRVSYVGHAVLGWNSVCGPRVSIDATAAKQSFVDGVAAITDASSPPYGPAPADYQQKGPAPTPDDWVFYAEPGDFGGLAIVGGGNGKFVTWGTTVWLGRGDIEAPTAWLAPPARTSGCASPTPPTMRLEPGTLGVGAMVDDDDLQAAVDAVWQTQIPAGIARVQSLRHGVVVGYARELGLLDPESAEYFVVLDSTLLE